MAAVISRIPSSAWPPASELIIGQDLSSENALFDQVQRQDELQPLAGELHSRVDAMRRKNEQYLEHAKNCELLLASQDTKFSSDLCAWRERHAQLQCEREPVRAEVAPINLTHWSLAKGVEAKVLECQRLQQQVQELELARKRKEAEGAAKVARGTALAEAFRNAEVSLEARASLSASNVPAARAMHNGYLNLKGNIRVFCRLRPGLNSGELVKLNLHDERSLTLHSGVQKNVTGLTEHSNSWKFGFDHIFGPDASQAQVFEEISLLVQSALDGYKVAIFAYGQTGGGKTYTMDGPQCDRKLEPSSAGIIPRTVDLIFAELEELREKSWDFELTVTLLEVYNESVYDLLAPKGHGKELFGTCRTVEPQGPASGTDPRCSVEQFTAQRVESAAGVHSLFRRAARERRTASTLCNDRSSRSHAIFQLSLTGRRMVGDTQEEVSGLLSLVDLAGSERVEKSGASGDRLREAQYINRSLSALGDVVEALAKKGQKTANLHVPYRNSRLTMLLKDSLGGDSKALMFVNISPCLQHLDETLSSLRFASKVHACNVGIAKRHTAELKTKKSKASLDMLDWPLPDEDS